LISSSLLFGSGISGISPIPEKKYSFDGDINLNDYNSLLDEMPRLPFLDSKSEGSISKP
jgi:hypothetical protein